MRPASPARYRHFRRRFTAVIRSVEIPEAIGGQRLEHGAIDAGWKRQRDRKHVPVFGTNDECVVGPLNSSSARESQRQ